MPMMVKIVDMIEVVEIAAIEIAPVEFPAVEFPTIEIAKPAIARLGKPFSIAPVLADRAARRSPRDPVELLNACKPDKPFRPRLLLRES